MLGFFCIFDLLLNKVLNLYGIDVMEYNGGMTQQQRGKVLEAFRTNNGKRVLLLSNVGATGLNLDVASILVIIVSVNFFTTSKLLM
jgi:SNF2 family DNA or RNA helicase